MTEQNEKINEKNAEIDDFYGESVEKTKNIVDEAIAKGYSLDVDRKDLELVATNKQFAERVLSSEDYGDLKDFCERLTPSQMNYIDEQIAKGKNKASFVKKLADIAKDKHLAQELRNEPLHEFKKQIGGLKQGLHKSNVATAIPTNYQYSDVPSDFETEFKQAQKYYRNRGY
ncbi:hypothetical protein [Wolbachia endosymbiont of Cantharis cryptica]|uniref:hypothetical protein n=1 Tax=Wolbachia endosymbiont of Cantharis cryptica TaxID=3066132 RepID=UPI00376F16E0